LAPRCITINQKIHYFLICVHKEFRFVVKVAKCLALALVATCVMAAPALAQEAGAGSPGATAAPAGGWISFSGAFGVGLTVIGAAYGIGRLAGAALESMARQPEVAGNIQTAMIIAAALIEGFTFYALFICSTQNPWG
jgi:F-type H+-transporting ATPase subunit c